MEFNSDYNDIWHPTYTSSAGTTLTKALEIMVDYANDTYWRTKNIRIRDTDTGETIPLEALGA